jgi:hypothetical protein
MTKARDIADLGAVTNRLDTVGASDGALSNRNAIINGSFKVSQRGDYTSATTVTTNYGFLVDRWVAYGNFGSEFTNANNTAKLEATSSATNRMFLRTKLEAQDILGSTTYTLSFFVTTNSSSFGVHINDASGTVDTSVISVPSGVRTKVTVTFDTPASVNAALEIAIGVFASGRTNTSITTGDYFTLEEVQLEVGDTATPFEHRTYADTLQACERYFQKRGTDVGGWEFIADAGQVITPTSYQVAIRFDPPMRAAPTVTNTTPISNFLVVKGGPTYAISSATATDNTNGRTLLLAGNSSSGGASGDQTRMQTSVAGSWFYFDAEL